MDTLERLGRANLDEIEATVRRYGIDCDFARTGELNVATAAWQVRELTAYARRGGGPRAWTCALLDRDAGPGRGRLPHLPRRRLGPHRLRDGRPGPAGLGTAPGVPRARRALLREHAGPSGSAPRRHGLRLHTWRGRGATPAGSRWPPARTAALLRRLRHYVVPVYDYALMTEPLTAAQLASIGWRNRQGIGDARQPVPLLPAHRGQPDPLGRLRRGLLPRRPDHPGTRPARGHLRGAGRALRADLPAAGRRALHPQVGRRDRHLQPVQRASSAPRTAAGWRTRPATPASAWAPPGSAPT